MSEKLRPCGPTARHRPDMSEKLPLAYAREGADRLASPVDDGDPVRGGRRGRRRRRDVRVRLPDRGAHPPDRVDVGPARGPRSAAEIDRVVSERMRAGEDLYHLDEGALAGPGRRPGRHPGPLRGLRRRRLGRRRRAGAPRLSRRRADHRPAHPRRGARVRGDPRAVQRPRRRGRAAGRRAAGAAGPGRRRRRRPAAPAMPWSSSGPTRRSLPGTGYPRWSRGPAAPACSGRRARSRSGPRGTRSPRPDPRSSWWRPVATTWPEPPSWPATSSPATCCRAAYRCGPWTRTRRSPDPVPGWSTASRRWRRSSTRRPSALRTRAMARRIA